MLRLFVCVFGFRWDIYVKFAAFKVHEFDSFKSVQEGSNFRAKPVLSRAHLMPKMWYRAKLNISINDKIFYALKFY